MFELVGGILYGFLFRFKGIYSLNGMRRNRFFGKVYGGFKDKEFRVVFFFVRVNNS